MLRYIGGVILFILAMPVVLCRLVWAASDIMFMEWAKLMKTKDSDGK